MVERVWRCPEHSYWRVLPEAIGVRCRGCSRRLQRVASWLGLRDSFETAHRSLKEIYRFDLSQSTVRALTLEHAERITRHQQRRVDQGVGRLPAKGAEGIITQADGSFVNTVEPGRPRRGKRPRQWKEVRLCCALAKGAARPVYGASFEGVEQTGRQWAFCAKEAGRGLKSRIHTVVDGAEWITLQARQRFGEQGRILLDFYHLSESLAEASHRCRPQAPERWRKTQQKRLKAGRWKQVLKELEPLREAANVPEEEAPVRRAWRYLSNRTDQLFYDEAIQEQLPIGSGIIESGHKHVLQSRLKKSGIAWLPRSAETIAQARTVIANEHWELCWESSLTA